MKYTFTIFVGRVWIVIRYFLFEKQTFKRLLKVKNIFVVVFLGKSSILCPCKMLEGIFFFYLDFKIKHEGIKIQSKSNLLLKLQILIKTTLIYFQIYILDSDLVWGIQLILI